jgi:transposase
VGIAPDTTGLRVTAGVDGAKDDHVVCVVGDQGQSLDRFQVPHDAVGRKQMAVRVAMANQPRAYLQIVFPAAATMLADIDSAITLSFLQRFTTQDQADRLSPKRLAAGLCSVSDSARSDPTALHARLLAALRGATGEHAAVHAGTTKALVAILTALNTQIQALAASIGNQLDTHPDPAIFTSLPRSGSVRAALQTILGQDQPTATGPAGRHRATHARALLVRLATRATAVRIRSTMASSPPGSTTATMTIRAP